MAPTTVLKIKGSYFEPTSEVDDSSDTEILPLINQVSKNTTYPLKAKRMCFLNYSAKKNHLKSISLSC